MNVFLRIGAVMALLLAVIAVWPTQQALAAGSVQPSSGGPGTVFNFSANGYRAEERVDTWINTPGDQPQAIMTQPIADANGAISWQWTAPAGAAGGTWRMVARGRVSRVETIIPLQIDGPTPTPTPNAQRPAGEGASPASGGPGTLFTITASGFTPNERLDTWANTPSGVQSEVPAWVFADAQGAASWQWTAPADAENGTWQLIGRGIESRTMRIVSVQIIAGPPPATPTPDQGVSPASGLPGTTFSFYASGFRRDEDVNFWGTTPSGDVETNAKGVRANRDGRAEWSWIAPANAAPGVWTMTARGAASRVIRQISFTVQGVPATPLPADGVIPPNGPPGTSFHFGVSGFEFEAYLTYWTVDPNGVQSGQAPRFRADRNGHAEFDWIAPENSLGGQWQMVVFGLDSRITTMIPFRIDRDSAPPASEGVEPYSATPGTELRFFAEGLPKHMLLGYWATDPSGVIVPSGREIISSGQGRAEWRWVVPQNAPRGLWTMTIRRAKNDRSDSPDVTRTIRFEVR